MRSRGGREENNEGASGGGWDAGGKKLSWGHVIRKNLSYRLKEAVCVEGT